jgi:hypothetical protein
MDDHLRPETSLFADQSVGYHRAVSRWLLPEEEIRPGIAAVVCLPSFSPEWAIRIHGSEEEGFTLSLAEAKSQIWCSGNKQDIEISQHHIELEFSIANQLRRIWCDMLRAARYPEVETMGLDGTRYHFFCYEQSRGLLCGHAWSPDPETSPGHLVDLGYTLRDYVRANLPARDEIGVRLKSEMDWFHDKPIRPLLRENATITLEKNIKQLLAIHERGIITDAEAAGQIALAFDGVLYPTVYEILDIVQLIPEHLREIIRSRDAK